MSDDQSPVSAPAGGADNTQNQLLFGAIGAFCLLAAASAALMQKQMMRSEATLHIFALLGALGFAGLGMGLVALGKQGIAQAKAAAPVVFIMAVVALLPSIAVFAKSLSFLRIAFMVSMIGGAIAWTLVGLSLQNSEPLLGKMAKWIGIALLVTAVFDIAAFALMKARFFKSRGLAETVLYVGYAMACARMVALLLTGVSFINLRAKNS